MKTHRYALWTASILILLALVIGFSRRPGESFEDLGAFSLVAPALAADPAQSDAMSMLSEEAGIAAYVQASTPVDLQSVKSIFRTIEDETEGYIIGSVPVEGYPVSDDLHLFVNTEGWFVAYYLASEPATKIIDWIAYESSQETINTKLERVLATAAGVPYSSLAYYDFRHPQATHLMLVAKFRDTFTIQLPSDFTFYELSWSSYGYGRYLSVDGKGPEGYPSGYADYGKIPLSQLSPDTTHTIQQARHGALALVYRKD